MKCDNMYFAFAMLLLLAAIVPGCSNKPGLLERNGIKDSSDLGGVAINIAEGDGSYRITDSSKIDRIYQLINSAERVSWTSTYIRPNMVTLIRKDGHTLSFAFSLWDPSLAWQYASQPFVDFVKKEVVGNKNYVDKSHLPSFSVCKTVRVEGYLQHPIPAEKAVGIEKGIRIVASAYKPWTQNIVPSSWQSVSSFCTKQQPGFEVILDKPISFKSVVGKIKAEPPHGSDALRVKTIVVDKMLVYLDRNKLLSLALHSTSNGSGWFVAERYDEKQLGGQKPMAVYGDMIGQ